MANIGHRSEKEAAQITISASQTVLAFIVPVALGMAVIGYWLIPLLYGQSFAPAVLPFVLMLPGIVAVSSYLLLEPYFQSRNMPMVPVKIAVGGALANFGLSVILIPSFGLVGAGFAYSLSYFFQLGISCYAFWKHTNMPAWSPLNLRQAVAQAVLLVRGQLKQRPFQVRSSYADME